MAPKDPKPGTSDKTGTGDKFVVTVGQVELEDNETQVVVGQVELEDNEPRVVVGQVVLEDNEPNVTVGQAVLEDDDPVVGAKSHGVVDDTDLDDIDVSSPAPVSMRLPGPPVPPGELTHVRADASVKDFLENALAQVGDRYQRGVENRLDNDDPNAWDGSELVQWSANRAGSMINDGAANQFKQMNAHGDVISVDDALHTPGAILYEFTGDPLHGTPTRASTAISLGDGRIIDIDPEQGVRIIDAKDFHFTHAGVMPGFVDSKDPGADVDALVQDLAPIPTLGMPAAMPPVPDPPAPPPDDPLPPGVLGDEADFLEARAEHLRALYNAKLQSPERSELEQQRSDYKRAAGNAEYASGRAQEVSNEQAEQAAKLRAHADELEAQATASSDSAEAAELREQATADRAAAVVQDRLSAHNHEEFNRFGSEVNSAAMHMEQLDAKIAAQDAQLKAAESAIDTVERQAALLHQADAYEDKAIAAEREAAQLEAQGDKDGAAAKRVEAEGERLESAKAAAQAHAEQVDDGALRAAGLQAPLADASDDTTGDGDDVAALIDDGSLVADDPHLARNLAGDAFDDDAADATDTNTDDTDDAAPRVAALHDGALTGADPDGDLDTGASSWDEFLEDDAITGAPVTVAADDSSADDEGGLRAGDADDADPTDTHAEPEAIDVVLAALDADDDQAPAGTDTTVAADDAGINGPWEDDSATSFDDDSESLARAEEPPADDFEV
jgi:hypothetical protein